MSTQRVERIEVRAFKAFKHLNFELDGIQRSQCGRVEISVLFLGLIDEGTHQIRTEQC